MVSRHYQHKYGVGISAEVEIGAGSRIAHYSCIFIAAQKIGCNLTIYQGCTIGSVHGKGVPTVGNNVVMYAGSKIVGNITIGNNVVVGANAIVVKDVPDNAVVVGIPARVVSYNASAITQYFK